MKASSSSRHRIFGAMALSSALLCAPLAQAAVHRVPPSIPHDYRVDVTAQLQRFIDSVPDHSVIEFPALRYDETKVGYIRMGN